MEVDDTNCAISPTTTCVASSPTSSTITPTTPPTKIPFQKCVELCSTLEYTRTPEKPAHLHSHARSQHLPDAPRIPLSSPSAILEYCLLDLDTPRLNALGSKLWWVDPTPAIVSLTQHAVLERRLQVTEDPSVHMLWVEGILFVKPLPAYLASYAFWEFLLDPTSALGAEERARCVATSLGFLKTYAALVRRRSDFEMARKHELLWGLGDVSFEEFVAFIKGCEEVSDQAISERWRYGLLHLDALNFHSVLRLRRWHLNRYEARWATYFSRFFPVVLFLFAVFSVMLSAMQVIIASKQMWDTDNKGLKKMLGVYVWFATEAIGWSLGVGAFLIVWWVGATTNEVVHRRRMQRRAKKRMKEEGALSQP
jgi:hypothetical protein